jgi:AcrR family transcriptional regulator
MTAISPTEDRTLRADARRNRERILAGAREVFGVEGAEAQMDDIARAAGVGVGTVYRHFPTKDALMGELIRLKFVDLTERARAILDEVEDPWEAFETFVTESAEKMAADRAQQRMMWLATPAAFMHAIPAQQELSAASAKIIKRAQKAGALRKDWSAEDLPTLMCGLTSSMQMGIRSEEADVPVRHDWRKLLQVSLDGLRAR